MTEAQANGFDRFNEALRNLDDQLQDARDRFDDGRKRFEKRVRKQTDRIQGDLQKTTVYKRAEQAVKDVEDVVDRTRTTMYDAFGLASKTDVDKLNRKLNKISKQLNELLKEHA